MTTKNILLSEWSRVSCIKYKKGSVMIVEDKYDVNEFDECYQPIDLNKIKPNNVYQYIISNKTIKVMPTMKKNEIGSKHDCLVRHFGDDDKIISSGELIKKGDKIIYSCMSSLFLTIINILWKEENISPSERQDYKDHYERNIVRIQLKKYFKKYKIQYTKNIEFGKKKKFNPQSLCKSKSPPKCLRYMKNKDCKIQKDNPKGPDCSAGVDFCSNLNVKDIPDVVIPESQYIYKERLDMDKVKEHYTKQGKKNLKPMALKMYMRQDNLDEKEFKSKEIFWPILEN